MAMMMVPKTKGKCGQETCSKRRDIGCSRTHRTTPALASSVGDTQDDRAARHTQRMRGQGVP
eukprot:2573488-Rhodomonas_salina.1